MMQMLSVGGVPVLTDDIRASDQDNLNGYFEFEPVKTIRSDSSWLEGARGKAVKIIYALLTDLPTSYEYRLIFMHRNLQEIVRSQDVMLARRGEQRAALDSQSMAAVFERQLCKTEQWLAQQTNFQILDVAYRDVINDPLAVSQQVSDFLDIVLARSAMASVVDPSQYRQRQE